MTMTTTTNPPADRTILVWDLPTRLFHWSLVALVALAWATGEADGVLFTVHKIAGYGVLVAILFRLIWGFVGSPRSRFRDFVHPWPVVRDYAKGVLALRPRPTAGHNPLGGWMILLLIATLLGVVVTGLFAGDDGNNGPFFGMISAGLVDVLTETHEGLTGLLLALIAIHLAGVVVESVLLAQNLVVAMWTGRKRMPPSLGASGAARRMAPAWYASLALAVATGLVWALVT